MIHKTGLGETSVDRAFKYRGPYSHDLLCRPNKIYLLLNLQKDSTKSIVFEYFRSISLGILLAFSKNQL